MRMPGSRFGGRYGRKMWGPARAIVRNGRANNADRLLVDKCNELQSQLDDTRSLLRQIKTECNDIRSRSADMESHASRLQSELLRAHSDIQRNRRLAEEKENQAADKGRMDVAKRVMTVADEFSTAMEIAEDQGMDPKWFDGFKAMSEKIDNCLLEAGYRRFESVGEELDPTRHEALATMPTSDEDAGKIIQVIEAGYEDAETSRVVRVAKVLVGRRMDES